MTSGTDNNWGFGILVYPDNIWVCDSTLRYSSEHTSVKLSNLVIILLLVSIITAISYGLQPLFGYCVDIVRRKLWSYSLEDRFISLSLHGLLQLHRIAVEKTTGQKFEYYLRSIPIIEGGGAGEVPRYGGRAPNEARLVNDGNEGHELGNVERLSREAISISGISSGQTVEVSPRDSDDDVEGGTLKQIFRRMSLTLGLRSCHLRSQQCSGLGMSLNMESSGNRANMFIVAS